MFRVLCISLSFVALIFLKNMIMGSWALLPNGEGCVFDVPVGKRFLFHICRVTSPLMLDFFGWTGFFTEWFTVGCSPDVEALLSV